ncbi:MAG TPA: SDR family oxidoreductase [Terriglobia bacterium]|nr:SDR family oxidoreductase [Terriglobia bacterium]
MATYVVTGGAGFIGSHIAEELVRRGQTVRIIDNFYSGKEANVAHIRSKIELIKADIADDGALTDLFKGTDYVIHQAAIPSVPKSMIDPARSNRANVDGTLNVLVAAKDAHVKRVVYASSSSVYGDSPTLPKREDMTPDPLSPYGAQKLFGEMYCRLFTRAFGLETVSLRYFNVFGPRQDATSQYSGVLAKFIPAILQDREPVIFGDGLQSRDFTYVANVVEANLLACVTPDIAGEVFNIACGDRITVNLMVDQINKATGKHLAPTYQPIRKGDIKHSQADISRAASRMGYAPRVTFEEGLRSTISWYRENLSQTVIDY